MALFKNSSHSFQSNYFTLDLDYLKKQGLKQWGENYVGIVYFPLSWFGPLDKHLLDIQLPGNGLSIKDAWIWLGCYWWLTCTENNFPQLILSAFLTTTLLKCL